MYPEIHVHHEDEDPSNNDPANLRAMRKGAHTSLHNDRRKADAGN